MAKYKVTSGQVVKYAYLSAVVEADSVEEAADKFWRLPDSEFDVESETQWEDSDESYTVEVEELFPH